MKTCRYTEAQIIRCPPLAEARMRCRVAGSNDPGGAIFVDQNMGDKTQILFLDRRMQAFAEKGAAHARWSTMATVPR